MKKHMIMTAIIAATTAIAGFATKNNGQQVHMVEGVNNGPEPAEIFSLQSQLTKSVSTRRVWVKESGSTPLACLTTIDHTYTFKAYFMSIGSTFDGGNFYYVDVPLEVDGVSIQIWNSGSTAGSIKEVTSTELTNGSVGNFSSAPSYYYIPYTTTGVASTMVDTSNLGTELTPTLAAKVIEGYCTCSDSNVNGYGKITEIKENWYTRLANDTARATFNATAIDDIAYTDDTKTSYKACKTTCGNKLAMMKANKSGNSGQNLIAAKSSVSSSNSIWAAVIISAAAVATFTIAFITINSKKRKKE